MSFRYILRYLIDPHFDAAARIAELVDFCRQSSVEEVMMFITAEELSGGHPTEKDLEDYIALCKQLKGVLDENGIALSLNPWATVCHNSRGRTLREGQNFRRMVGETGVESPVVVCPLCPNWQHYIQSSFRRLVEEIQPLALWIEDDWRLKNHAESLGWGGCFCGEHLRLFSEKAGCPVTREELLSAILRPGTPHPWRSLWLDLSCETLLSPLKQLAAAVREVAPGTRIALMSPTSDDRSVEGWDWLEFQQTFGTEPSLMIRPNMSPYTQMPALQSPPTRTRMTLANLSGPLEIYPELESSPRCGSYSKSAKYAAWQMMNCAFMGSQGITINHYDMLGNGISLDPDFGHELQRKKAFLNSASEHLVDDRCAQGARILFSPQVSRHMHTSKAGSLLDLTQQSALWGDVCATLGIAYCFVRSVKNAGTAVLVSGQTLRALDDATLENLFRGSVLLDADAVMTALDMGLGSMIGVESADWTSLQDTAYSYEEILEHDPSVYGVRRPRMSAQRCGTSLLAMKGLQGSRGLTRICKYDHSPLWHGCLLFSNALGGTVASMTYRICREAQFFMGFFNVFRRTFLQRLLWQMSPLPSLAMTSRQVLHCYRNPLPNGLQLALTNPGDDSVNELIIDLPPGENSVTGWTCLDHSGQWKAIHPTRNISDLYDRFCFPVGLDYLQGTLLRVTN